MRVTYYKTCPIPSINTWKRFPERFRGGGVMHFISARVNSASRLVLAEEELLREAKRGAARASVSGPLGWVKCPLRPTNKRFLRNTILHTINNNSRHSSKTRKNQDLKNKSVLSSNSKTSVDSTKYKPNKRVEGHEKTNKNKVDKGSVFQTSSKLKNKYRPHITSNSPQNQHSHKTNHDKLKRLKHRGHPYFFLVKSSEALPAVPPSSDYKGVVNRGQAHLDQRD
uniref:Uncharacterized protein n=1 Tax=Timema cristinae TaxID=61476 RepID=A0A7R9CHI8_TIMCR|nr:unnamed protein product [Timema cristinae]